MTVPSVLPTLLGAHRHPRGDRRALLAFQDARLRRLVRHPYANVPYYRDLFDQAGIDPRHIRGVADLTRIPISTKPDLRAQPSARMIAHGLDPSRLLTARTSGSSGEPFSIRAPGSRARYNISSACGRRTSSGSDSATGWPWFDDTPNA